MDIPVYIAQKRELDQMSLEKLKADFKQLENIVMTQNSSYKEPS